MRRKSYIIGGYSTKFIGSKHPDFIFKKHPDFGKRENPNLEWYISQAVNETLNSTGTDPSVVDKSWIGNFCGELFSSQGHLGAAVNGSNAGLMNKPCHRVEAACASGGIAVTSAVESIQAGNCDVALVVGAEVQTTVSARIGGDYLARASHYARQRKIDDFTFPALFARRVKACQEELGYTFEDLGAISAKAYSNANKNPNAHMVNVKMDKSVAASCGEKNPFFLGNEELRPYLRLSDCSQVSDGGAGMIIVSEEGLKKLGKQKHEAIEIMGLNVATGNLYEDSNPTSMPTTAAAAAKTIQQSGVALSDIGVAEVHDCFSVAEMLMLEAIGFCPRGGAKDLVRNGDLELNGRLPINTSGGRIARGHAVGATGVVQFLEIYQQMKGLCGERQISKIPSFGMTANMGGDDKTAVVSVLKNCS